MISPLDNPRIRRRQSPLLQVAYGHLARFAGADIRLIGTMATLGLSLLPLSALLVALPLVAPNEAVLSDSVRPAKTRGARLLRRLGGLGAGLFVLLALFAFAVEFVTQMPLPEKGQLGVLAQKLLRSSAVDLLDNGSPPTTGIEPGIDPPTPKEMLDKQTRLQKTIHSGLDDPVRLRKANDELAVVEQQIAEAAPGSYKMRIMLDPTLAPWLGVPVWTLLPRALVQHWPFVFLTMYATDLVLLLLIGRVPLAYNLRNLIVRWRIAGLTALAFTVVVALLVALLAFVNGMYRLNEGTGIPGNVFVLSDGATDELFSNLGFGDIDNAVYVNVNLDSSGNTIPQVQVARAFKEPDGTLTPIPFGQKAQTERREVFLASREIFFVVSQSILMKPGDKPRRRLLNLRAIEDPHIAASVHNIALYPGGSWFGDSGVREMPGGETDGDGKPKNRVCVECVIGEGTAATLGPDAGKARLEAGDTFSMGDFDWVVSGVMRAEGTTFGSEIWVKRFDRVTKPFGKSGELHHAGRPHRSGYSGSVARPRLSLAEPLSRGPFQGLSRAGILRRTDQDQRSVPGLDRLRGRGHGRGRRLRRDEYHVRLHRRADQGSGRAAHPRLQALAALDFVHARIARHRHPRRAAGLCDRLSCERDGSEEPAFGRNGRR